MVIASKEATELKVPSGNGTEYLSEMAIKMFLLS